MAEREDLRGLAEHGRPLRGLRRGDPLLGLRGARGERLWQR